MAMARKELCQLNYTLSHHRMMPGKSFTLPRGVIHFSLCRTRFRARLIHPCATFPKMIFLRHFWPVLRLRNYKLKVIDMQIAITLRNNHHAKRVPGLFIYWGAASVRATFSFPDPRNSILCSRSLIIFAETAPSISIYHALLRWPGIYFLKGGAYVGFIYAGNLRGYRVRELPRNSLKILKVGAELFPSRRQDDTWITDICYKLRLEIVESKECSVEKPSMTCRVCLNLRLSGRFLTPTHAAFFFLISTGGISFSTNISKDCEATIITWIPVLTDVQHPNTSIK